MYKKTIKFIKTHEKILKFAGVFLAISVLIILLQPLALKLIKSTPMLNSVHEYVKLQIEQKSIFWLFIVSLIGTLFFIGLPNDFIFLYYIMSGANPFLAILATFMGSFLTRIINFGFGYQFRGYTYKHIISENKEKFHKKFSKVGNGLLFWGNYIPGFPMEAFIVFVGATHYKFKQFLLYQGLGKLTKLIFIWIFVKFFVEQQVLVSFDFFSMIRSGIHFIATMFS